jgi:Flp pilus assembly protein TadD
VDDFTRALSHDPYFWQAALDRGQVHFNKTMNYEEAATDFRKALSLMPEGNKVVRSQAHHLLGLTASRLKDEKEAVFQFSCAIEARPDWFIPYISRANVLDKLGRKEEAAEDRKKAKELQAKQKSG